MQRNRQGRPGKEDVLEVLEVDIDVCMVEEIRGKRLEVMYCE